MCVYLGWVFERRLYLQFPLDPLFTLKACGSPIQFVGGFFLLLGGLGSFSQKIFVAAREARSVDTTRGVG